MHSTGPENCGKYGVKAVLNAHCEVCACVLGLCLCGRWWPMRTRGGNGLAAWRLQLPHLAVLHVQVGAALASELADGSARARVRDDKHVPTGIDKVQNRGHLLANPGPLPAELRSSVEGLCVLHLPPQRGIAGRGRSFS